MLVARSVEEAHLYMDLRGCDPGRREHALVARGGDLVSVYRCRCRNERRTFEFFVPHPTATGLFGDEAPSTIIGPAEFLDHASRLAASFPAIPDGMSDDERREAARRLEEAAACLDEVLKFIPPDQASVPVSAFRTDAERRMFTDEPGRFSRARLRAVAAAYRSVRSRFVS
jgi:hypothetical protein